MAVKRKILFDLIQFNRCFCAAYHAGVNGGLLDVSGDAGDEGVTVLKVGVEVGLLKNHKPQREWKRVAREMTPFYARAIGLFISQASYIMS